MEIQRDLSNVPDFNGTLIGYVNGDFMGIIQPKRWFNGIYPSKMEISWDSYPTKRKGLNGILMEI